MRSSCEYCRGAWDDDLRISCNRRTPALGLEANIFFASNDLAEAKLVANEIGFNSMIVRVDPDTGEPSLVYDAAFNEELPLDT